MRVGILGLGLIGGSFARAYQKAGHTVYAQERNAQIFEFARLAEVVAGELNESTLPSCDLVILSVYPDDCITWLSLHAQLISANCLVIDSCGTKTAVCAQGFALAQKHGFTFVGCHPMAGTHNSGFKYSRSNLFQGAPMVLCPPRFDDMELLQRVKDALSPCKFGMFSATTAQDHDRMIAFTSQMPHIISNAFIKSPTALEHRGFSAGSYKDLTRVAWLNPQMWAELFLNNRENVLNELAILQASLSQYASAIENNDRDALIMLLQEGKQRKEQVDG